MKKIMRYVDRIPVTCPICHSPIQRIIKEYNCIPIDDNGMITDLQNTLYKDYIECSRCHENLDDTIKIVDGSYTLYSNGVEKTRKNININLLSLNPFGKII